VLTYAPDVLRMDVPCSCQQLDPYRFTVSIEDRPWFSGALGRFLVEGMRANGPLQTGQTIQGCRQNKDTNLFEVTVLRADERGVWELEFTFHQPLASKEYCFYLGTAENPATRLQFAGPEQFPAPPSVEKPSHGNPDQIDQAARAFEGGNAEAGMTLLAAASFAPPTVAATARVQFRHIATPFLEAQGYPGRWEPTSAADLADTDDPWPQLLTWWRQHVSADTYARFQQYRSHFDRLRARRDMLYTIRRIAAWIIRSDLYLTGPPYPDPRSTVGHHDNIR